MTKSKSSAGNENQNDPQNCTCSLCATHGQAQRLIMGLDHQVVIREDGTATAWTNWETTPRSSLIRFRRARDGGLVPEDRGERRAAAIYEVAELFRAHEIPLSNSEKRGPVGQLPSDVLVPLIDQLHAEGITKTRAYALVAEQNFMRPETVRRLYLAQRETFQNKSHASTEVNDNGPWGPDVSNWVRGVEKAKKCTQSEAAREVCEVLGWTMDDYIHHTVGKWHWDATIRNPRRREKGDWVRVTDEAPTKKWPDTESSD